VLVELDELIFVSAFRPFLESALAFDHSSPLLNHPAELCQGYLEAVLSRLFPSIFVSLFSQESAILAFFLFARGGARQGRKLELSYASLGHDQRILVLIPSAEVPLFVRPIGFHILFL
jgi:hypothetical protein